MIDAMPGCLCPGRSLGTHTQKWSVALVWTCSFHQDESLDDTGQTLI